MLFRKRKEKMQYDFEVCYSGADLTRVIAEINKNGYVLVTVAFHSDCMTVFFGRPVDG